MSNTTRVVDLGEMYGKVILDPAHFEFNPDTLSVYLEKEAGWYDYYGQKLADAEYLSSLAEEAHDLQYAAIFRIEKGEGATEKQADARAKSDPDVVKLKQDWLAAKHKVGLLKQHLKSWDKSHDNAQNRGNTLRKEMDRISGTIYEPPNMENHRSSPSLESHRMTSDQVRSGGYWDRQGEIIDQKQAEAKADCIIKPMDRSRLEELPE